MNLRAIRKKLNLTQQAVADELGIKVAAYSKLERGKIQLTVDRLLILSKFFNLSPDEILFYDEEVVDSANSHIRNNVTYVPVSAQAGFLSNFSSDDHLKAGVQFSVPVFYEDDLFLINLEGDSMYPTFSNGDYIFVRKLDSEPQIKWGEPYLIVGNDGKVVKRIMKSTSDHTVLLKSDNELYEPYEIQWSHILTIWEVKGVISKNLAPRFLRQI